MTENEIKQRLSSILQALDTVQVSGMKNVQNLAWSMTSLADIIKTSIIEDCGIECKNKE